MLRAFDKENEAFAKRVLKTAPSVRTRSTRDRPQIPEVRKEARMQLVGTTGMMILNAGLKGTWFYGIAMMLAGMFMDDDKDPEAELKKNMIEALGRRCPVSSSMAVLATRPRKIQPV